jgi:FKBP-type peptidyl-prolyl cis-trans isomerase SlyD
MDLRTHFVATAVFCGALLAPDNSSAADAAKKAAGLTIVAGTEVALEYTVSDDKGKQIESNKGKEPLVFIQGQNQVVPGLEKALNGLHAGEERDLKLAPEQAYGAIQKEAFQEIPKEQIPAEAQRAGTMLQARSPEGDTRMVRVSEVKEKTVVIDFNHPLAGKTLAFHVKVLDVKTPETGRVEGLPAPSESQPAK